MLSGNETELIERCVDQLNTWKGLIAKYLDDDEKAVEMEKLQNVVKGVAEVDMKYKKNQDVFVKIDEYLDKNDDPSNVNVDKIFNELLNELPASSENNVTDNHVWKKIFQNDQDLFIVEKKKKKQLADENFDTVDDSLLCSNVFTPPVDPISKAVIRNPYRNKVCKHVYEFSTITDYINQLRHRAKCPYIGCNNNNLRKSDLKEDNQLQSNITQYLEDHEDSNSSSDE